MVRLVLYILLLPLLSLAADIIPDERRTDWSYAGVPGGIDQYVTARTNLINVRDYGATGDGVTDDYTAISAAFGAINETSNVVYFPSGRYVIGTRIYYAFTGGGFTVRGAGTNSVLIVNTGAEGFWFGTGEYPSPSVDTTLTADGERGATNITVADATSFTVGKVMVVDQLNDPAFVTNVGCAMCDMPKDGTRQLHQRVKITAVDGNTITFWPPLLWTFGTNLSAKAYEQLWSADRIGIESMKIIHGPDGGNGLNSIVFDSAYQCWVKDVAFENISHHGVYLYDSLQCEVRGCSFSRTNRVATSNRAYGVESLRCSHILYQDNWFHRLQAPIMFSSSGGCVMGYNYVTNCYAYNDTNWLSSGFTPAHGAHSYLCLAEGNVGGMFEPDNYFGSSSHHTAFRNWFMGWDVGVNQNQKCVDLNAWVLTNNVVGNVLGVPHVEWDYYSMPMADGLDYVNPTILRMGFPNMGNYVTNGFDPRVEASTLLHGNYDYFTNGVRWDGAITNRTFEDSLYLASKPTWYSNATWPPVVSTTPSMAMLPAQMRFNGVDYSGSTPTPSGVLFRANVLNVGQIIVR